MNVCAKPKHLWGFLWWVSAELRPRVLFLLDRFGERHAICTYGD